MKVLVVSHSSEISGGANRSLLSVIDGLRKRHDVEITVLVMKENGALIDELSKRNVDILCFPYHSICTRLDNGLLDFVRYTRLYFYVLIDWFNAVSYCKKLKKYKFDLIYTNTRLIYFGGFLAKMLKIPHIWHIREYGKENGGYSVFFANKLIENLSNRVIFISRDLQSTFEDYKRINGVCIYNGIPHKNAIVKKEHDGVNLLLTGRLVKEKGQMQAIDAIDLLQNAVKCKVNLFLAGSGDNTSKYVKELHRKVDEKKLPVVFCGEVGNMDDLRSITDIELMCAEREAFGRVTIEALQCGIPVIGANTGATPEIITDEVNGLIYDKKSTEELSKCIEQLVIDERELKRLTFDARKDIENKFSIDQCVDAIYQQFINACS